MRVITKHTVQFFGKIFEQYTLKIQNINNFQKLKPPASCEARTNLETGKTEYIYDEDLDDDEESVFDRLPDNVKDIQEAITCSQGCMLLLVLREHLKDFYGFTTA